MNQDFEFSHDPSACVTEAPSGHARLPIIVPFEFAANKARAGMTKGGRTTAPWDRVLIEEVN